MNGSFPVVPLTSYVEIMPISSSLSKKTSRTRTQSILLTPSYSASRCPSKKATTPRHPRNSLVNTAVPRSNDPARPALTATTTTAFTDGKCNAWEDNGAALCEGIAASRHASRVRRSSCTSSDGGRSSSAARTTYHRTVWFDVDPLSAGPVLDPLPFKTFTSHLREQLALAEAAIEGDINSRCSNSRSSSSDESNPVPFSDSRTMTPHNMPALPRVNSPPSACAAGVLTSPAAAPHIRQSSISVPPLSPRSVDSKSMESTTSFTEASVSRTSSLSNTSADDDTVNALSVELTALLRQADLVAQQLASSNRGLQPEHVRYLNRLREISGGAPVVPGLLSETVRPSPTSLSPLSPLAPSIDSSKEETSGKSSRSSGLPPRSPPQRMVVRAPRSVKWDQSVPNGEAE